MGTTTAAERKAAERLNRQLVARAERRPGRR
jgi:hypothetical protein